MVEFAESVRPDRKRVAAVSGSEFISAAACVLAGAVGTGSGMASSVILAVWTSSWPRTRATTASARPRCSAAAATIIAIPAGVFSVGAAATARFVNDCAIADSSA